MHAAAAWDQCLIEPFNFQNICFINIQILSSSPPSSPEVVVTNMKYLILYQYYFNVQILRASIMKRHRILYMCCYCTAYVLLILPDYLFELLYYINIMRAIRVIHLKLLVMTISDIYVLVYPKLLLYYEDVIGCRLSKVTKN